MQSNKIGCVILANTQNLELYGMTHRAIQTLIWSESSVKIDINIIESNPHIYDNGFIYNSLPNINVIIPNEDFSYNKFLNYGCNPFIRSGEYEWIIVANNDIIFTNNWLTRMLSWQSENKNVLSLSPWEPNWHPLRGLNKEHGPYFGYRTSYEITGWCLVINANVFNKCNIFDPLFEFWYQDNDYALTLEAAKITHALLPQSRVYHMVSKSHHIIDECKKHKMTNGQLEVLRKKWGNKI